jgi:hypothetical protein
MLGAACFAQQDTTVTGVRLVCMKKVSEKEPQQVDRTTDQLKTKLQADFARATLVIQKQQDTLKNVRIGPCTSRVNGAYHPLIVVDGVIKEYKFLEAVNPNDIQSIEVLKDQKAIDRFGEKAKNGVILVTMKCKEQKTPSM